MHTAASPAVTSVDQVSSVDQDVVCRLTGNALKIPVIQFLNTESEPIHGLLNVRNYFDPLLEMLLHAERQGFVFAEHREMISVAAEPPALLDAMENHQHPTKSVRRWMRRDE